MILISAGIYIKTYKEEYNNINSLSIKRETSNFGLETPQLIDIIIQLQNLKELNIFLRKGEDNQNDISNEDFAQLFGKGISQLIGLEKLFIQLNYNSIYPLALSKLGLGIGYCENLTELNLNLYSSHFKDCQIAEFFAHLKNCQKLTHLNLKVGLQLCVDQKNKSCQGLGIKNLLNLTKLTLYLTNIQKDDQLLNIFVDLKNCKKLKNFDLSLDKIQNGSISIIGQGIEGYESLTDLNLNIMKDNVMSNNLFTEIRGMVNLKTLVLDFEGCLLEGEALSLFGSQMGMFPNLESLKLLLKKNDIDGKTISLIVSELEINKKLLTLNLILKYQNLKCQDMIPLGVALSKLQNINTLKLDLNNNQISSKGFYELINCIENCSRLQYLSIDLSQNLINNSFQSGQQNNQNLKINEPQKNQILAKSSQLSSLLLSFDNQSQVISDFKELICQIKKFSSLKYIQIDQFRETEEWEWYDQDSVEQLDFPQILKRKCSKLNEKYSFKEITTLFSNTQIHFKKQNILTSLFYYHNNIDKIDNIKAKTNAEELLVHSQLLAAVAPQHDLLQVELQKFKKNTELQEMKKLVECYILIGIFLFIEVSNCDTKSVIDKDLSLYQCQNCSLAIDSKHCKNSCKHSQFYQELSGYCMTYCGNGSIAFQGQSSCQTQYECVDGSSYSQIENKCIRKKTCSKKVYDLSLNLFQCLNCTFTSDINLNLYQCPNCSIVSNIQYCQNTCKTQQYFSQINSNCYQQCENGRIQNENQICSASSNLCIDGFQWDNKFNKCIQCAQTALDSNLNLQYCPNCSLVSDLQDCQNECQYSYLVTDIKYCQNNCTVDQFYLNQQNKCMHYCQNGFIAEDISNCFSNLFCLDGSQWNFQTKKCEASIQIQCPSGKVPDTYVKICSNCSFVTDTSSCQNSCYLTNNYVKVCNNQSFVVDTQYCQNECSESQYYDYQQNQCMYYCRNGLIAPNQSLCQSTNICVNGYILNSIDRICEKKLICEEKIVDSILGIYQCPNCSLVTNTQFCQNKCLNSQFYSQANCMIHCGQGLIAKEHQSCQSSNLCIDGYIFTEEGKCNPYDFMISQKMDQNLLIICVAIAAFFIFVIIIFVIWVVKKIQSIKKVQIDHSEKTQKQQLEAQKNMAVHQEEIQALQQKLQKMQQIAQNEIILCMNNQKEDLEEQSFSQQTINMLNNQQQ
ncbi:hypothetical protein ABPG74_017547 [Tetrahymena malaccensis]